MDQKNMVALFWSGGKDSSLTYHYLKSQGKKIKCLVTTIIKETNEVRFSGIPEVLISNQAKLMNIPVLRIYISKEATNQEYEEALAPILSSLKKTGVTQIAFGDIHLNDIKEYKEKLCHRYKLEAIFPLWLRDSKELVHEFLSTGHRAIISAIDESKIPLSILAKELDENLIAEFTEKYHIDPCGENGEYHSFTTFSPYFKQRISFSKNVTITDGPYTICKLREP